MENQPTVTILMTSGPDLAGKVRYLVAVGENDPHEHYLKFDDGTSEETIFAEAIRIHNIEIERTQKEQRFNELKSELNQLSKDLGYGVTF